MSTTRTRVAAVLAGVVLLAMLTTACDGGTEETPATGSPATAGAPATPSEEGPPSNELTGFGDTVLITDDGFVPQWLVAPPGTVTFRNEGSRPVAVVFNHQAVRSGPIPPGETFVWEAPNPVSVTYHAKGVPDMQGQIQVQLT